MTIIRRANPFDELFTLRRAVDRLFDDDVFHPRTWRTVSLGAEPALDITTTTDALVVKASLPGWQPEDVEITLTGSTLTISGEMREEARREDESWILNEIRRASFSRTLELPEGLIGDRATATYEHGILTLHIPKAEEVKPKQIRITAPRRCAARARARRGRRGRLTARRTCSATGSIGTRPAPSTSSPSLPGSSRSTRGRSGSTRTRA